MSKFVALLTLATAAFSQTPSSSTAPPLTFEVASVKQSPPLDPQKIMSGQMRIGMRVDKALVEINSLSLADLINIAFKVKAYQVTGPSWLTAGPMTAERFDVHAKLPDGATEKEVPEMLQALLVERFKLTFHRDSTELPVYALLVGKGGPKMKDAPPDADPAAATPGGPAGEGGSGADPKPPQISGRPDEKGGMVMRGQNGNMRMSMKDGIMRMEAEKLNMSGFADMLSRFMDRPVLDMTELKGNYQVALELTMSDMMSAARASGAVMVAGPGPGGGPGGGGPGGGGPGPGGPAMGRGGADGDAADPGGSSIFRSVQQLGLKLEARKSAVGKLIIDHVEKVPSEN
jgi:uncharacterized protein (TIGR03435 family)